MISNTKLLIYLIFVILITFKISYALVVGGLFNGTNDVPSNGANEHNNDDNNNNNNNNDDSNNNEAKSDEFNIEMYAFKYALKNVSSKYGYTFEPKIKTYLPKKSSLLADKCVCELLNEGAVGIFGPQFGESYHTVQAVCDHREIPHVLTRWEIEPRNGACSINLFPYTKVFSKLVSEVVKLWEWDEYTILYEDSDSLMRVSDLVLADFDRKVNVHLKRLNLDDKGSYRTVLRTIKESTVHNIILDCSIDALPNILEQAQQVGLMGSEESYIITNLDFHTLDLEPYKYGGTNITGFRMVDTEIVRETVENLKSFIQEENPNINPTFLEFETLRMDAVLMIDAVRLYADAAFAILDDDKLGLTTPCDSPEAYPHGFSIINHIKMSNTNGCSGNIQFDHLGFRSNFRVQIIELSEDGIVDVGIWSEDRINMYRKIKIEPPVKRINSLKNTTFTVVIPMTSPYGMLVKSWKNLNGNDQYEGYCVDLINHLSTLSDNFTVNFKISLDGKGGSSKTYPNKSVVWDGMVGMIINGEADLACGDLTISREREEAVDFTSRYMNLGIAILYRKPKSDPPGFFSFLSPFKAEVWILVITAYIGVSLMFFIMGRISPYEWTNPFPCVQDPDELENQFTLSNSFWFTVGALMQQGSEIAPISVSTRMAAGIWWFFTLIMVSCYTANLAAFLTLENPNEEFTNIEELAKQNTISYGAKSDGTTLRFFNESSELLHKQMFNTMMSKKDDVLVNSPRDGVSRAVKEKYAFLMESSQIEYETERECMLTQIGKPIDDKGYGIAMKKGSWYLGLLSQNILKMQEDGVLSDLKRKWWKEKYAGTCDKTETNDVEKLGMSNLGGVFLVLGLGVVVGALVAIAEQFLYVWSLSREGKDLSIKEIFWRELRFFLRCRGTTKPASFDDESSSSKNSEVE